MQQTDILCTTNQRPVSSDGGITDDSVCLCAVKWRRLLSSLIHWYSEREIIIYYFPNSLKEDVWPSVHTCGRAAAGWSQMRQRALRRAGGEKISHHANDLQLAGFTSGDREVLQSHRAEAQQATLTNHSFLCKYCSGCMKEQSERPSASSHQYSTLSPGNDRLTTATTKYC